MLLYNYYAIHFLRRVEFGAPAIIQSASFRTLQITNKQCYIHNNKSKFTAIKDHTGLI